MTVAKQTQRGHEKKSQIGVYLKIQLKTFGYTTL